MADPDLGLNPRPDLLPFAFHMVEGITEFLNEIQPPELVAVFRDWVERVRLVLENNGDYYHE
jgi:hypothetical protein